MFNKNTVSFKTAVFVPLVEYKESSNDICDAS